MLKDIFEAYIPNSYEAKNILSLIKITRFEQRHSIEIKRCEVTSFQCFDIVTVYLFQSFASGRDSVLADVLFLMQITETLMKRGCKCTKLL